MTGASPEDLVTVELHAPAMKDRGAVAGALSDGGANHAARLIPRHWRELEAHVQRRSPLIAGLLDMGAMSLIYGTPGCGKTFIALDLALHIASGKAWRGRSVNRGPVVYVAAEGGVGLADRLAAARSHLGLSFDDCDIFFVPEPIDLRSSDRDVTLLLEHVRRLPEPPLAIFIDTLSRALAGGDENSSVDMGGFIRRVDMLRAATGAHVVVIHHPGKTSEREARGHFSLKGAVDTEILVKGNGAGRGSMTVTKQRDRESGDVFGFRLKPIGTERGKDGEARLSCAVEHAEIDPEQSKNETLFAADAAALDALVDALRQSGHEASRLPGVPCGVRVVSVGVWMHYALAGEISRGTQASRRRAFNRAKKKLVAMGMVGEGCDHVWLTDETPPAP